MGARCRAVERRYAAVGAGRGVCVPSRRCWSRWRRWRSVSWRSPVRSTRRARRRVPPLLRLRRRLQLLPSRGPRPRRAVRPRRQRVRCGQRWAARAVRPPRRRVAQRRTCPPKAPSRRPRRECRPLRSRRPPRRVPRRAWEAGSRRRAGRSARRRGRTTQSTVSQRWRSCSRRSGVCSSSHVPHGRSRASGAGSRTGGCRCATRWRRQACVRRRRGRNLRTGCAWGTEVWRYPQR